MGWLTDTAIWGHNSIISYTTNKHAGFMPGYKQQKQGYIHYTTQIRGFDQQTPG